MAKAPGQRMRFSLKLIGALAAMLATGLAAGLAPGPAQAQSGFDRRGGEYLTFSIRTGDPSVCAARCERENRCRAWSFSYPRTTSVLATCRLMNQVPPRSEDACCVSGVRGAGVVMPRSGAIEYSIDRIGGDYRNFDVTVDAAGADCETMCKNETRCRAWTYVRPGYIGPTARCYLKDKIKPPHHKPCCISGVVR